MNVSNMLMTMNGFSIWSRPALIASKGSVLVYLIVVILIFGVLGVTMVSLFTTTVRSVDTGILVRTGT